MTTEDLRPEDLSPLFIPLKTEFYRAFQDGTKLEEFRVNGPRWNLNTCQIGRRVTLSHGYSSAERMTGVITGVRLIHDVATLPGWAACYGSKPGPCIAIRIAIISLP